MQRNHVTHPSPWRGMEQIQPTKGPRRIEDSSLQEESEAISALRSVLILSSVFGHSSTREHVYETGTSLLNSA